jgi:4-carboxymuconolactone decarboxylase
MTDTLWTRRGAAQLPLIALLTTGKKVAAAAIPTSKGGSMTDFPAPHRSPFADIAPALADYTDNVLFGDVWKRPGLSPRDRSLVTVASLIAQYRINEMPFHLKRALENGVTREELIEAITHLAFYAGWPTASTAVGIARRVFDEEGK